MEYPSEDPYEEACQHCLLEQAPRLQVYTSDPMELEDLMYQCTFRSPEHPDDLRARLRMRHLHLYIPTILSSPHTDSTLLVQSTSNSRRADIPEADTPPQKRLLLTTPPNLGVRLEKVPAASWLRETAGPH
ncbi:hypothetical protein Tco_1070808 [Tanacetum coccineum]|uniref:Uncharacterized protein n=1 Tax=Tanacetum coccineum TaxID=301880 RepID=A0ABQ5HMG5_9ASTR